MIPVQFITHCTDKYTYLDSARMALEGGCRWIQLRMKDHPLDEVEETGRQVQALCKAHDAIFVIDDHVELAQKLHADGVHLGLKDMPVHEARKVLGEEFLIGGTANTFEDILLYWRGGADYIGCGPFRFTETKKNLSPILGLEGYAGIVRHMQQEGISLPIVAIGGITNADIPALMETGISGIALSGSILRADNPVEEMQSVCRELKMNN